MERRRRSRTPPLCRSLSRNVEAIPDQKPRNRSRVRCSSPLRSKQRERHFVPESPLERRHVDRKRILDKCAEEQSRWKLKVEAALHRLGSLETVMQDPRAMELTTFLRSCLAHGSVGAEAGESSESEEDTGTFLSRAAGTEEARRQGQRVRRYMEALAKGAPYHGGTVVPRIEERGCPHGEAVCSQVCRVLELDKLIPNGWEQRCGDGHSTGSILQLAVLAGQTAPRGGLHFGCDSFSPAYVNQDAAHKIAEGNEVHERLEEAVPAYVEETSSLGPLVWASCSDKRGVPSGRLRSASGSGPLPEDQRVVGSDLRQLCETKPARPANLERAVVPVHSGKVFKDRTVRRHSVSRPFTDAVGEPCLGDRSEQTSERKVCRGKVPRVPEHLHEGLQTSQREGPSLGCSALGGLNRQGFGQKIAKGSTAQRKVVSSTFSFNLREARAHKRKLGAADPAAEAVLREGRSRGGQMLTLRREAASTIEHGGGILHPARSLLCHGKHGLCSFRRGRHVQLDGGHNTSRPAAYPPLLAKALATELVMARPTGRVVDAFSGSGVVGDWVLRFGVDVISVEISSDATSDALGDEFCKYVCDNFNAGRIRSVCLPFPCTTFSIAQSRGGRAIRSRERPRGIDADLTVREQERITQGNHVLDKLIAMLRAFNKNAIPYVLENPYTSYAWDDPGLRRCLKDGIEIRVHQCAFRARHRKDTLFIFKNW